jgi:Kef-type K+ transport system membrane component KefB
VDAALFFALSLSITAFPVLARILEEHGIARTTLGTLVIGAAATNDAVAWCLLAILLGMVGASAQGPVLTLGATLLYVALMLSLGRMGLRAFSRWSARQEAGGGPMLGAALLVVLLGSWWTTVIGIHLIFGAFIAGVAMPRGGVALALRRQLESVTTALFLPLFFVYSGLNTRLALLNTPALWLLTALVVVLAVAGKGLGCALAARGVGMPWRAASAVGTLMNARGLIELVLLNVGLERHFITPVLFTILVVMALVTTMLTTPIFRALYPRERLAAMVEPLEAVSPASPGELRHV